MLRQFQYIILSTKPNFFTIKYENAHFRMDVIHVWTWNRIFLKQKPMVRLALLSDLLELHYDTSEREPE